MDHSMYAAELFMSGCNCSQAVLVAFCDLTGLEPEFAKKLSCGFGGGLGRLREVCGAVSGMIMAANLLYGYTDPGENDIHKKEYYSLVQELCRKFREQTGSIICRELLDNPPSDPTPCPRTAEYYAQRPCARMVMIAANVLDHYIAEHPLEK